eukprot:scaffold136509_cov50-Prasinocladus_malaysianus.AAC.1
MVTALILATPAANQQQTRPQNVTTYITADSTPQNAFSIGVPTLVTRRYWHQTMQMGVAVRSVQ